MEKILYLESDEEVTSVINRLKKTHEKRVALVIPSGAVILTSAVNLRLLSDEGKKTGKKIAIVTTDRAGGNIATQLGFTVYENIGSVREAKERDREEREKEFVPPRRMRDEDIENIEEVVDEDGMGYVGSSQEKPRDDSSEEDIYFQDKREKNDYVETNKNKGYYYEKSIKRPKDRIAEKTSFIYSIKFWLLSLLGFAVVLFLLLFIFPKATVHLNVYAKEDDVNVPFQLSAGIQSVEKKDKVTLPAKWEEKEQEVAVEVAATGQKNIGAKAKGVAVVYNRSGKSVEILQGTEFLTGDNKVYLSTTKISAPGASVSEFGEIRPGTISVPLEASEGGSAYNIGKSRFYIPALGETSGNLVYAQTEEGLGGGDDQQAVVATKEDIAAGKAKAQDEAMKKMQEDFGMKGDRVFVNGLGKVEVASEEVDRKENEPAEKINVRVKYRLSFLSFNKSDFDDAFRDLAGLQLGEQKELVGDGYRSVEWQVSKFDEKAKTAEVLGKAKILAAAKIKIDFIKSKIITLNVSEMRSFLAQYPDVELEKVKFFPPLLLNSIPSNERNIEVKVEYLEK